MNIQIAINDEMKAFANIALKSRLYVSGWVLSGVLVKVREGYNVCKKIAIAEIENKPVGVAIVNHYNEVQVFVRKSERKKGIGKNLVESLNETTLKGNSGIDGSLTFFDKIGVKNNRW